MSTQENLSTHTGHMLTYPTNRLACYFEDIDNFQRAMRDFAKSGFDVSDIHVLHGKAGVEILDIDGSRHGTLARISRLIQSAMADSEIHELETMRDQLEQGHIVIAVATPKQEKRDVAQSIMHNHNGHHITFFARFYVETFEE